MLLRFFVVICLASVVFAAPAISSQPDCELCDLYKNAQPRQPRPFDGQLVCVHFTLPTQGAKVAIEVSRKSELAIKYSKRVAVRDGQFCFPFGMWMRLGKPDKVFLCSKHSVTLNGEQIEPVLSGPGGQPHAYACLRGIKGCGGVGGVSILARRLNE